MTEPLVDIAGREIRPGDPVVYPQMSGRCVQMVLGELVSFDGEKAKVRREEGSRWSASYSSTAYRDKRTGKGLNVWTADMRHWEKPPRSYFRNPETGEEVGRDLFYQRRPFENGWEQKYERGVLKDYVEEYKPEPKPVTISNVKNIVRVT